MAINPGGPVPGRANIAYNALCGGRTLDDRAERHNEQRRRLLTMEFHTFVAAFIDIPAQIVKTGRRVRWRILAYDPWLGPLFRLVDAL